MHYYYVSFYIANPSFSANTWIVKPVSSFVDYGTNNLLVNFIVSSKEIVSKRQFFLLSKSLPYDIQVYHHQHLEHINQNIQEEYVISYEKLCQLKSDPEVKEE